MNKPERRSLGGIEDFKAVAPNRQATGCASNDKTEGTAGNYSFRTLINKSAVLARRAAVCQCSAYRGLQQPIMTDDERHNDAHIEAHRKRIRQIIDEHRDVFDALAGGGNE